MISYLILAVAMLFIIWQPRLGLAAYLIVYPMIPKSAGISLLEISMLALSACLFMLWISQKMLHRKRLFNEPEYRWLYFFFFFLGFSPVFGFGTFTIIDWGRDIVPLLNLLLIPIIAEFFKRAQARRFIYLVMIPALLSAIQAILSLLSLYNIIPVPLWLLSVRLILFHPSLGFGLGLVMYLHKIAPRWFWLILCGLNLIVTVLTPGRTIWIGTAIVTLLIIFFHSTRILSTTSLLAILIVGIGYLVISFGSEQFFSSQAQRYQKLQEYEQDLSWQNRVEEMKQCNDLFLSSPIYGVGFGYQYAFWRPFISGKGEGYLDTNYTHNDIMFIASKGGAIGILLFSLMIYTFMKELHLLRKEKSKKEQAAWSTIGFLTIISSLIIGLSTPIYQTRQFTFILMLLIGYALGFKQTSPAHMPHQAKEEFPIVRKSPLNRLTRLS